MGEQTLNNKIGNCIGEAKRRMLDRLKDGADLDDAIAQFIGEIRLALQMIAENVNRGSVPD